MYLQQKFPICITGVLYPNKLDTNRFFLSTHVGVFYIFKAQCVIFKGIY